MEFGFVPLTVEPMGSLNTSICQLFVNLGRKISSTSGDETEGPFLFQRVSVLVQRYNANLFHETSPAPDRMDWWSVPNVVLS